MTRAGDLQRIHLSASSHGRPIPITAAIAAIHAMTTVDALDSVWLDLHNTTDATVAAEIVIAPADATAPEVDLATISVLVPANSRVRVLDSATVSRGVSAPYQIGVGASKASAGDLIATGWVVRRVGALGVA